MQTINIKKESLKEEIPSFVEEFKEFRHEKNVIRTIKFKGEIIKANRTEGKVLDKVCRSLVLGEAKDYPLKYK